MSRRKSEGTPRQDVANVAGPLQWHTEITIAVPRERVWAILDDITLISRYHPEVRHVELLSGTKSRASVARY